MFFFEICLVRVLFRNVDMMSVIIIGVEKKLFMMLLNWYMVWNGEVSIKYNRISRVSIKWVYSELYLRNFCLGYIYWVLVWIGLCLVCIVNFLKYFGIERLRKMEILIMKILWVMFMFVNCSCEILVLIVVNKCMNSEYCVMLYEEFW